MKAGDLRHRITFQYRKLSPDSFSSSGETWTDSATVWGAVWPVRSAELIGDSRRELEVTHRFIVRYRKDVRQEMRIVFRGANYDIVSIINKDERNISLEILASKRV